MRKAEARERIDQMLDEYAYSNTWPLAYQREYERLCDILWADHKRTKGR